MKKHYTLLVFGSLLLSASMVFAQMDSIEDQGVYRTFLVHLPAGYNPANEYPLVLNLHGLNSNASQQAAYSQFNAVADTAGFIVVYPNALGGSWEIGGDSEVDFMVHLVHHLRTEYSANDCLFLTGMSQGGFLSYKLACALPIPVTAIAVVTGNMTLPLINSCVLENSIPLLHFHGTADPLVDYNGTFGIPPVETTISWWADENGCNATPVVTSLPNTNISDGTTVERHRYSGCADDSEVILYKILNGGHTWPGALPIPAFGPTTQDIHASNLIGGFFEGFCAPTVGLSEVEAADEIIVYPNPATLMLHVQADAVIEKIDLYDAWGRQVAVFQKPEKALILPGGLSGGVYSLRISTDKGVFVRKVAAGK